MLRSLLRMTMHGRVTAGRRLSMATARRLAGSALLAGAWCITAAILPCMPAQAQQHQTLQIAEPFIELHTGPGRGYPVFHVIERGRQVELISRRTDWFLLRTDRGVEGWTPREQLLATLQPDGQHMTLDEPSRDNYLSRRWQGGVMGGDFGGASLVSAFAGWHFTEQFVIEASASHVLGEFSDGYSLTLGLVHVFTPQRRLSPYFTLGGGLIRTEPKATLVRPDSRDDQLAYVGAGLQLYLTRRFMLRSEYRNNIVLTDRDDNEEVREWKYLGFAFFL